MAFDDRMRLSQLRKRSLRSCFVQGLLHCVFRHDRRKALLNHCPEAWIVDSLLADLEELCDYAWLILGVEAITLYFAQEEICRVEQHRVHHASPGIRHRILKKSG